MSALRNQTPRAQASGPHVRSTSSSSTRISSNVASCSPVADLVVELWQVSRQRRRNVQPRIDRRKQGLPLLRASPRTSSCATCRRSPCWPGWCAASRRSTRPTWGTTRSRITRTGHARRARHAQGDRQAPRPRVRARGEGDRGRTLLRRLRALRSRPVVGGYVQAALRPDTRPVLQADARGQGHGRGRRRHRARGWSDQGLPRPGQRHDRRGGVGRGARACPARRERDMLRATGRRAGAGRRRDGRQGRRGGRGQHRQRLLRPAQRQDHAGRAGGGLPRPGRHDRRT